MAARGPLAIRDVNRLRQEAEIIGRIKCTFSVKVGLQSLPDSVEYAVLTLEPQHNQKTTSVITSAVLPIHHGTTSMSTPFEFCTMLDYHGQDDYGMKYGYTRRFCRTVSMRRCHGTNDRMARHRYFLLRATSTDSAGNVFKLGWSQAMELEFGQYAKGKGRQHHFVRNSGGDESAALFELVVSSHLGAIVQAGQKPAPTKPVSASVSEALEVTEAHLQTVKRQKETTVEALADRTSELRQRTLELRTLQKEKAEQDRALEHQQAMLTDMRMELAVAKKELTAHMVRMRAAQLPCTCHGLV
jgi:hypothetical protein